MEALRDDAPPERRSSSLSRVTPIWRRPQHEEPNACGARSGTPGPSGYARRSEPMSAGTGGADVAVIGAGSSGFAVVNALRAHDVAVECFERGAYVGGLWRYENDNGLSGAYASLRTNASRLRRQYPASSCETRTATSRTKPRWLPI